MTLCYLTLAGENLEGVGATPNKPFSKKKNHLHVYESRYSHRLHRQGGEALEAAGRPQRHSTFFSDNQALPRKANGGRTKRNGIIASYTELRLILRQTLRKGAHLAIEGELTYREYERTIETSSGPVKVRWPVTEVVVHSIKPLDRSKDPGPEEAA